MNIKEELKVHLNNLGIMRFGITDPNPINFKSYQKWIQNKYHGSAQYLQREDALLKREYPNKILPDVKSVIVVLAPYSYKLGGDPVSAYARGKDYHKVLKKILKDTALWLKDKYGGGTYVNVDTGPVLEKDFAVKAGLGFYGKNTLLLTKEHGSAFFIGEIFSTLDLPKDIPDQMPSCGSCMKCITLCPTKAIVEPYVLDSTKCISYYTTMSNDLPPEDIAKHIKADTYGCDICQAVCPYSSRQLIGDLFKKD